MAYTKHAACNEDVKQLLAITSVIQVSSLLNQRALYLHKF